MKPIVWLFIVGSLLDGPWLVGRAMASSMRAGPRKLKKAGTVEMTLGDSVVISFVLRHLAEKMEDADIQVGSEANSLRHVVYKLLEHAYSRGDKNGEQNVLGMIPATMKNYMNEQLLVNADELAQGLILWRQQIQLGNASNWRAELRALEALCAKPECHSGQDLLFVSSMAFFWALYSTKTTTPSKNVLMDALAVCCKGLVVGELPVGKSNSVSIPVHTAEQLQTAMSSFNSIVDVPLPSHDYPLGINWQACKKIWDLFHELRAKHVQRTNDIKLNGQPQALRHVLQLAIDTFIQTTGKAALTPVDQAFLKMHLQNALWRSNPNLHIDFAHLSGDYRTASLQHHQLLVQLIIYARTRFPIDVAPLVRAHVGLFARAAHSHGYEALMTSLDTLMEDYDSACPPTPQNPQHFISLSGLSMDYRLPPQLELLLGIGVNISPTKVCLTIAVVHLKRQFMQCIGRLTPAPMADHESSSSSSVSSIAARGQMLQMLTSKCILPGIRLLTDLGRNLEADGEALVGEARAHYLMFVFGALLYSCSELEHDFCSGGAAANWQKMGHREIVNAMQYVEKRMQLAGRLLDHVCGMMCCEEFRDHLFVALETLLDSILDSLNALQQRDGIGAGVIAALDVQFATLNALYSGVRLRHDSLALR
jgi:hypothetical protein